MHQTGIGGTDQETQSAFKIKRLKFNWTISFDVTGLLLLSLCSKLQQQTESRNSRIVRMTASTLD